MILHDHSLAFIFNSFKIVAAYSDHLKNKHHVATNYESYCMNLRNLSIAYLFRDN